MKLARVLVVVKETALELLQQAEGDGAQRMLALLKRRHTSVRRIRPAHEQHHSSTTEVLRALRAACGQVTVTRRVPTRPVKGYDLVVSLGGDGMVLGLSHAVRDDTPVLGVNSSPEFSVGHLCGATADDLPALLDALQAGSLRPTPVARLQVKIGGRAVASPVLNDVLFCADNPAVMTRYRLMWPGGEELQRSSGLWVSTPAGSTSALASAGGPVLHLGAKLFAFQVREPYAPPGEAVQVKSAVLSGDDALQVECRINAASVFLDGSHRRYPVPFGYTVTLGLHPSPLQLITRTERGR